MKKPFQLSFDGKGLNITSEEFSPRFATIHGNFLGQEHASDARELGRMMEATPELLAALEMAARTLEANGWAHGCPNLMGMAHSAIAKAKGREDSRTVSTRANDWLGDALAQSIGEQLADKLNLKSDEEGNFWDCHGRPLSAKGLARTVFCIFANAGAVTV